MRSPAVNDFWRDVAFVIRLLLAMAVPVLVSTLMGTAFVVAFAMVVRGVQKIRHRDARCCLAFGAAIVAIGVALACACYLYYFFLIPASALNR